MRAGFIALIGLPNVGKSTLLNRLLGQKIAIASPKPQTTRNRILGVRTTSEAQLVLIDTPGLARPARRRRASQLERYMVDEALAAISGVDALLLVLQAPHGGDAPERGPFRIGGEYDLIEQTLGESKHPVVVALNKIDLVHDKRRLLPMLDGWAKAHDLAALVPISAATGEGVERLEHELCAILPESDRLLFPEDMVTDRAERWLAAECVREQVFLLTRQEVPYGVAVTVDTFNERPARAGHAADVVIEATIHVEKEAQKAILIGERGHMIREIGTRARASIGELLGCPAHLQLFVRLDPDWTERIGKLRDMGYE